MYGGFGHVWVGLGWVDEIRPTDNSELQIRVHCCIYDEQAQLSFLCVNALALHKKDLIFEGNAHSNVM